MKIISIILGILAFIFMVPGLIPCLGWLNWVNIGFSAVGLLIAVLKYIGSDEAKYDNQVKIALFLNGCAFIVGVVRLSLGGGFF